MSSIGNLMPIKTAQNWCQICGWRYSTGNCGRDDCPRADEKPPVKACLCDELLAGLDVYHDVHQLCSVKGRHPASSCGWCIAEKEKP